MTSSRVRICGYLATALLTTLTIAACGSTSNGAAIPAEMDVRTLDVGSYTEATIPLEMRYTYHNDLAGAANLALMRLADHVAIGPDIDPRLKFGTGSIPITDAERATDILADANKTTLERNKMMFGFAAGASDKESDASGKTPPNATFTTIVVMQFPDEEAAKQAAVELDQTDFDVAADENERVELSKYPAARSHWRPGVATIGSTLAYGKYVINLYLGTPEADPEALKDLATKVYTAQLPLLNQIPALSPVEMLFLEDDPDQMLRRTLNTDGIGTPSIGQQAAFTLRGYLHNVGPQDHWNRVMTESGVDRISKSTAMSSTSVVYRTRDAASAAKLSPQILEGNYAGPADAPKILPGARCGEGPKDDDFKTKRFRCVVTYRQYVATVESDQIQDAHQRATAQYALFANSQ